MKVDIKTKHALTWSNLSWGFLAQGLNIGTGLLLLPMILRYLKPDEIGLWFVFMSLAGLAQLLELGFQPTIARNVAYIYGGAQKLDAQGYSIADTEEPLNIDLLKKLFVAARRIYWIVSLLALVVLAIIGSGYISTLLAPNMSAEQLIDLWKEICNIDLTRRECWVGDACSPLQRHFIMSIMAWLLFSAGYVVNYYFGYYNGFLQGRGDVTSANQVVVASRFTLIVLAGLLLFLGYGLIGVGFASLCSSVISRILARKLFWRGGGAVTAALKQTSTSEPNALIKILWPNARKLGWVFLGAFLITRANVLIASSFLGLAEAGSYGLTLQILSAFISISTVVLNLQLPHINSDQVCGRYEKIVERFGKSLATGWLIFGAEVATLFVFGNTFLDLIGSRADLLEPNLLALFAVIMFLEMNHSFFSNYLTTFNEIPFVRAALVSGVGIVTASVLTISVFHLGAWGLVLSQGVIQILYNNWKWPMVAARKMNHSFAYVVASGFKGLCKVSYG